MIFIGDIPDLDKYAQAHYQNLKKLLENRIKRTPITQTQKEWLYKNLKEVICGKPLELFDLNEKFKKLIPKGRKKKNECIERLNSIFNYEKHFSTKTEGKQTYKAYDLTGKLGVNVCPYCNRNYITQVDYTKRGNRLERVRPELDHFFVKEKHPILALSFYNLIPSCKPCNSSLKHSIEFNTDDYSHPYIEGFDEDYRFFYLPTKRRDRIQLSPLRPNGDEKVERCLNNAKTFELHKLYQTHSDEAQEIMAKATAYSAGHFKNLEKSIPKVKGNQNLMYRMVFANYIEKIKWKDRPLSKFTFDLCKQFGVVDNNGKLKSL